MSLQVCVIGAGPRGTSVLERLCANAHDLDQRVVVHVVDPAPAGPGAVWRPSQSAHLLMNTVASQVSMFTDNSVDCAGSLVPGPSLYEWARLLPTRRLTGTYPAEVRAEAARLGPNDYPSRAFYGRYLSWVFQRIVATAPDHVDIVVHVQEAIELDDSPDERQVVTLRDGSRLSGLDRVVLALGHSPTTATREENDCRTFASRHRLSYIAPANPADVDLGVIEAGTPIAIRGMGLNFFDHLTLLSVGRGGRFVDGHVGLTYLPSGREPLLYVGSRRGIPYHARGDNEKGAHGRHLPRFLTDQVIAEFRARARAGFPVEFRAQVWPLIDREVRTVYHETMIRHRHGEAAAAAFVTKVILGEPESALLDRYGIAHGLRWNWARIERPHRDLVFAKAGQFQQWLLAYLRKDVAHARLGNLSSPLKTALDVLRDLRNEVRLVVDHGGISGESYRDELEGWYNPLNAFMSIGPPVRRIEEMIALIEAGVVRVVGPGMRVRPSERERAFLVDSALVSELPVPVRGLIEARLPDINVRHSANPLIRHLLATGQVANYRIGQYESGGLAVTERPYHVVDRTGRLHPARFAFGVPTEGVHWVTAAGIRPGVGSVTLLDSDAIARALLGVDVTDAVHTTR
jgi:uncharacterized NAD(P)/FAD-binding protein YdhS